MFFMMGAVIVLMMVAVPVGIILGAVIEGRRDRGWRFEIGQVLSKTFGAVGAAPALFIGTSVVVNALPAILVLGLVQGGQTDTVSLMRGAQYGAVAVSVLSYLLLGQFGRVLLIRSAVRIMDGERPALRENAAAALRLLPGAIALSILFYIATTIGLLFLVIPGIVIYLAFLLALPAYAAERISIFDSFRRSVELTSGARWRILLILMLAVIAWVMLLTLVTGLSVGLGGDADSPVPGMAGIILQLLLSTAIGMVAPAGLAAIYHEFRTNREGAPVAELAAVFA